MKISLHNLQPKFVRKPRKRVGRGNASGTGTYSGRGGKGQTARAGGNIRPGFEGGRTTLIMQTPKVRGKGFRSIKPEAQVVILSQLNKFSDGDKITVKTLVEKGLIKHGVVKILGGGNLTKKLQVYVPASASARQAIQKAGGTIENVQVETKQILKT